MTNKESLRTSFDLLREIAPKLNAATDDASRVITQVEKFLNDDCSLGLDAEVRVRGVLNEETEEWEDDAVWLAYARCGSGFHIAIQSIDEDGNPGEYRIWSQSPRDLKLLTFPKLPALLQEVEAKAGEALRATEEAASAAREILDAMSDSAAAEQSRHD